MSSGPTQDLDAYFGSADHVRDLAAQYGLRKSSGVRSPAHNAAVGGARHSYHLTGNAEDYVGDADSMRAFHDNLKSSAGDKLPELLDEGNHIHVAFKGQGKAATQAPDFDSFFAQRDKVTPRITIPPAPLASTSSGEQKTVYTDDLPKIVAEQYGGDELKATTDLYNKGYSIIHKIKADPSGDGLTPVAQATPFHPAQWTSNLSARAKNDNPAAPLVRRNPKGDALTWDGYPAIRNKDGSLTTERSITVTDPRVNGGKPTNIPSVWQGKQQSQDEAIKLAAQSKQQFPAFDSIDEAVTAAQARSEAKGKALNKGTAPQRITMTSASLAKPGAVPSGVGLQASGTAIPQVADLNAANINPIADIANKVTAPKPSPVWQGRVDAMRATRQPSPDYRAATRSLHAPPRKPLTVPQVSSVSGRAVPPMPSAPVYPPDYQRAAQETAIETGRPVEIGSISPEQRQRQQNFEIARTAEDANHNAVTNLLRHTGADITSGLAESPAGVYGAATRALADLSGDTPASQAVRESGQQAAQNVEDYRAMYGGRGTVSDVIHGGAAMLPQFAAAELLPGSAVLTKAGLPHDAVGFAAASSANAYGHGASVEDSIKAGVEATVMMKLAGKLNETVTGDGLRAFLKRAAANTAAPMGARLAVGDAPVPTIEDAAFGAIFAGMHGTAPRGRMPVEANANEQRNQVPDASRTEAGTATLRRDDGTVSPLVGARAAETQASSERRADELPVTGRDVRQTSGEVQPGAITTAQQRNSGTTNEGARLQSEPRPVLMPPLVKRGEVNEQTEVDPAAAIRRRDTLDSQRRADEAANANQYQGKVAKEIAAELGIDTQMVRAVRDRSGLEPHGPQVSMLLGGRDLGAEQLSHRAPSLAPVPSIEPVVSPPKRPVLDVSKAETAATEQRADVVKEPTTEPTHHAQVQSRATDGTFDGPVSEAYTPVAERAERSLPKTLEGQSLPKGSNLLYDRIGHPATIEAAHRNLADKGVDGAAEYVRNAEPSSETTATGYAVIDEYTKQAMAESDPVKRASLFDRANAVATDMSVRMTTYGQAIEAAKTVSEFGVASAVKVGQKTAESSGKRMTARDIEEITRAATEMKAAQAEIVRLQERVNEYESKEKKKTETRKARITKEFDAAEVAARERLAKLNIISSPIPVNPSERGAISLRKAAPQAVINDLASVMATKVSRGEKGLAEYRTEMATEFGEHFVDNRQRIEQAANKALKEANARETEPKVTARGELAKEVKRAVAGERQEALEAERTARAEVRQAEAAERQAEIEAKQAERLARQQAEKTTREAEQEDAMWARQERAAQQKVDLSRKRAGEAKERGGEAEYYRNLRLDEQANAARQWREEAAQKRLAAKEAQETKRKESEARVEEKKRLADEARERAKVARTRLADERKGATKTEREALAWDASIKSDARANTSDPVAVGAEKLASGKDEFAWRREMKAAFPDAKLDDVFKASYEKVKGAKATRQEAQEARRARLAGASSPEGIEQVRGQLKEQQKVHRDAQLALARTYDRLSGGRAFRLLSAYRKGMGLLSSPKTHARNILGNFAYQAFDEVARVPGAIMDFALSGVTKQRGLTGPSPTGMLDSTLAALKVGGKEAIDIIRTGQTAEEAAKLQIPQEVNSGSKIIDAALNATYRLLAAEDRIFYNGALRRNLYDRARSQALTEVRTGELKRGEVGKRTQELIKYPHEQLLTDAQHDALVATFNNDNRLSDSIKRARGSLTSGQNFALDLVMPYDRTPTNIVARMIEASPAGYLKNAKQLARAVMGKAFTPEEQRQFSQTFGRATVGTAMLALGYRLAAAGLMTGQYDDDERKRTENREKKEVGQQAGAIKIGGQWYQISGLAPLGNLMAAGATLYEKGIGGSPSIAMDALFEQPLMRASKEIVDAAKSDSKLQNLAGSVAGGFIPAIGADIATMTDDKARKTFGFEGQIKRRVPYLRNTLPEDEGVEHRKSWALDPFHTTTDRGRTPTQIKNEIVRQGRFDQGFADSKGGAITPSEQMKRAAMQAGKLSEDQADALDSRIEFTPAQLRFKSKTFDEALKEYNSLSRDRQAELDEIMADKFDRLEPEKVRGGESGPRWQRYLQLEAEFKKKHPELY